MTEYYRSHTATRPVILVIGSPEPQRHGKPPRYPHQTRQPWRPATRPPTKAERVIEFIRRVQKQDNEVRAFMQRAGVST
jgi:hypothetical protein